MVVTPQLLVGGRASPQRLLVGGKLWGRPSRATSPLELCSHNSAGQIVTKQVAPFPSHSQNIPPEPNVPKSEHPLCNKQDVGTLKQSHQETKKSQRQVCIQKREALSGKAGQAKPLPSMRRQWNGTWVPFPVRGVRGVRGVRDRGLARDWNRSHHS